MKLFVCPTCDKTMYFGNLQCSCGTAVVFVPEHCQMMLLDNPCGNRTEIECNWQAEDPETGLCRSCAMTTVIPDTFHGENRSLWFKAELSKRWVLTNLGCWGWFMATDQGARPTFNLLSEATSRGAVPVSMGHADGLVTINVTEADDAERIQRREDLNEPYRTMMGHFRHEVGHFLFVRLAESDEFIQDFRQLFGDERKDYGAAVTRNYEEGPPAGWQDTHISAYAASHPHEDWAESFAHLLHLTDMIDSAVAVGLDHRDHSLEGYDAYGEADSQRLIAQGADLALAFNHVNMAMGVSGPYPFVLPPPARDKIAFVHRWIRNLLSA